MIIIDKVKSLLKTQLDIGQDTSRPVQCLISTRDMHVNRIQLPARSWYILNEEDRQAYYLDTAGAFPIRNENEYEFIIDELNAFPWWTSLTDSGKCEKIVSQLNNLTDSESLRQRDIAKKNAGKDYQSRVILALLAGVGLVVVVACILFLIPAFIDKMGYEISWI